MPSSSLYCRLEVFKPKGLTTIYKSIKSFYFQLQNLISISTYIYTEGWNISGAR